MLPTTADTASIERPSDPTIVKPPVFLESPYVLISRKERDLYVVDILIRHHCTADTSVSPLSQHVCAHSGGSDPLLFVQGFKCE